MNQFVLENLSNGSFKIIFLPTLLKIKKIQPVLVSLIESMNNISGWFYGKLINFFLFGDAGQVHPLSLVTCCKAEEFIVNLYNEFNKKIVLKAHECKNWTEN